MEILRAHRHQRDSSRLARVTASAGGDRGRRIRSSNSNPRVSRVPNSSLHLQTGLKLTPRLPLVHCPSGRAAGCTQCPSWAASRAGAARQLHKKVAAMAEVAPAGAKEVDQRPNTHDPFWDGQNDILKTYSRAPVWNYCGDLREPPRHRAAAVTEATSSLGMESPRH